MTDPISDMLTRIRNAQAIEKPEVVIPLSKVKFELAKILKEEGYILDAKAKKDKDEPQGKLTLTLKYGKKGVPAIDTMKRVSKPSQRIYVGKDEIPQVLNGLGISIVSTSQGLMTGKHAENRSLGGELLCKVW